MKRFLIVLACSAVCVSASSFAGQDEKIDTIFLINGRTIAAKVASVTSTHVDFVNIVEAKRELVERKSVHKILFHNGVIQELNPPASHAAGRLSWTDVRLTDRKQDSAGLYRRGAVEAASRIYPGGLRAARRQAEALLKKKAAALRCHLVLVTVRTQKRAAKGTLRYVIRGVAYGKEPMK